MADPRDHDGPIDVLTMAGIRSSVDHAAESPIVAVLDDLHRAQEDLRAKDSVEEWLDEHCELGKVWTKSGDLYDDYCAEAAKQRRQTVGSNLFGRRMKQILTARVGGEGSGWKVSNGMRFRAEVVGECSIPEKMLAALEKNKPALSAAVNKAAVQAQFPAAEVAPVQARSPAAEVGEEEQDEEMNEDKFLDQLDEPFLAKD